MLELVGLALLGFVVGAYGTVIGAGGGFILVPVLLFLYPDYEPEQLTSISLAVVMANSTSGSIAYGRQHRIDYQTGLLFAACSAPGVLAGALVIGYVPGRLFSAMFGVMLLVLAAGAFRGRGAAIRSPIRGAGVILRRMRDPEGRTYVYAYRIWQGVAISLAVGFVSSLFGIGGGVMQVPAMIILLHIPIQYAIATSQLTLVFMAGGATAVHVISGTLGGDQAVKAVAVAAGAVPGAQVGALLAQRVKPRMVLLLLGGAILVLGVRLILHAAIGF
jgi:uncharacterized membrane protein YfcA